MQPDIADAWIGMGVCEQELGNTKSALKYLQRGLDLDEGNTGYFCIIADIYMAQGSIEKATYYFEKAIQSSPDEEIIRIDYADAMAEKKEYLFAEAIIIEALEKFQSSATLHFRMAAVLYLQGKSREASYFLEEGLLLDYEKNTTMLEQYPQLRENSELMALIDFYHQ